MGCKLFVAGFVDRLTAYHSKVLGLTNIYRLRMGFDMHTFDHIRTFIHTISFLFDVYIYI